MERGSDDTQQPSLCRMGCGFYGSSSSDGMCSKCFKDALRRKQSSPTTSATATVMSSSSTGLTEEPCTSHLPPSEDIAGAEVSPSSSASSVSDENDSSRQPEAQAEASTSETKDKAKTKRNRCFMCRKKVGLTGFECRCGNVYCGLHRYSDKHNCSFDYKADGRAKISKDNPVVVGSKIQKI
ncbi:AN1-type zinc finger protein 6-like [Orbicella faveolata]|uniref:AN1-type zinc finger protein 6-like n=1 Tax=Orbicella faveolata TaxID=48498 RepID=UPI0009E4AEE4|nr:AN1-type zinc finger protein 6-like [Orbicella faveolata]